MRVKTWGIEGELRVRGGRRGEGKGRAGTGIGWARCTSCVRLAKALEPLRRLLSFLGRSDAVKEHRVDDKGRQSLEQLLGTRGSRRVGEAHVGLQASHRAQARLGGGSSKGGTPHPSRMTGSPRCLVAPEPLLLRVPPRPFQQRSCHQRHCQQLWQQRRGGCRTGGGRWEGHGGRRAPGGRERRSRRPKQSCTGAGRGARELRPRRSKAAGKGKGGGESEEVNCEIRAPEKDEDDRHAQVEGSDAGASLVRSDSWDVGGRGCHGRGQRRRWRRGRRRRWRRCRRW